MMDMFTHKSILFDCPCKSNRRPARSSIITPRCAVWLLGVMHTTDSDYTVWSSLQSQTLQCHAHSIKNLFSIMRIIISFFIVVYLQKFKKFCTQQRWACVPVDLCFPACPHSSIFPSHSKFPHFCTTFFCVPLYSCISVLHSFAPVSTSVCVGLGCNSSHTCCMCMDGSGGPGQLATAPLTTPLVTSA